MSGAFVRKWTDEQRDACVSAKIDRAATYGRVVELAAAGELTRPDGTKLDPFEIPVSTVAGWVKDEKKKRVGRSPSALAELEPRDSTEILRRQLVAAIEHKIGRLRKRLDRDETSVSFAELREGARLLRELQALPGPTEERRPAPGQKVNGTQTEGPSRSALAREIMAAAKQEGSTAQDAAPMPHTYRDGEAAAATRAADHAAQERTGAEEDAPGSSTRSAATQLAASAA